MQYIRFSFRNFKGLRDASLQLGPDGADCGIVTLVGLNESGKTTILEAIDRFYPGKADEEIRPKDLLGMKTAEPFDLIPIAQRGNFNGTIEITATVRLDEADIESIKRGVASQTGFRLAELPHEVSITNRYLFANSKFKGSTTLWQGVLGRGYTKQGKTLHDVTSGARRTDWQAVVAELRQRTPRIWYFPNFLFEFPERVQLNESPDEDDRNRLFRALLQDILHSIDSSANIREHLVDRALSAEPADRASLKQITLQIGAEVTRTVVAQWNEMFGGSDLQGKRVFFDVERDTPSAGDVSGQFLLEDGSELFSIRERSLGFRWFFVYLLLTTYRARRAEHGGIVYLLDEPASNLHSSAQALLLESMQRLGADAQIIYTTHSHHLVNPRWLQSTFVVSNEGSDPSSITSAVLSKNTDVHITRYPEFAYEHPGRQHYFQPVLDVLAYRPADLELVPEVAMTEGKGDFYLLQYYLSVLREGFSDLKIMPGRGAGSLDEAIRLYLGWGRNFVVLLDSDQGGRDAAKHYGAEFGRVVTDRVLDLSRVSGVSSARGIETLLAASDRLAFQRLISPGATRWNKRMWSQGVEHALATGSYVEVSTEARDALEAVVSNLSAELAARRGGSARGLG